ncbi:MAG TPA: threonine synthase [Thermoanaerobaculia bacterium]|nr:threonine synthase [Thermoanaerobaculia bacterium]
MILRSTRDPDSASTAATFSDAAERSLAPDGGLYLPDPLPRFADVDGLLALDFRPRSQEILDRLLGDEIPRADLAAIVEDAFDFPVPLVRIADRLFALELFHGPTLAFKDFGARFLARVLRRIAERRGDTAEGQPRTVLTATSGDTGAAVAHAFWRVPGFRVVVLYPRGLVSPLQERQFATLGDNVRALAVAGTFDDCQALVKACFRDPELEARHRFTSANTINIARLVAQVLYYFEAVARLPRGAGAPVISVPSGNFGNLCAGLMAGRLGLPVRAFVAATNANTTVPEYLSGGEYRPRPSVATLSNAMDVGAPSNWERIEALYSGDPEALRRDLRWGSAGDEGTRAALRELRDRGYVADPHAAVAYRVLTERLEPGETGVFLATAHPAKFGEVLAPLGIEVPLPDALRRVANRPFLAEPLPNDLDALRAALDVDHLTGPPLG